MTLKHQRTTAIVSWAIFFAALFLTNPVHLPVALLVFPIIVLFVAVYYSLTFLLGKYSKQHPLRIKRLGAVVAAIVIIAVALQSLGQLTVRDIVVAVALICLGYFYIGRTATH